MEWKTLARTPHKEEILRRLETIRPDSARLWGRMSAHQMVCHLSDGFRLYMGLISPTAPGFPYPSRILKWGALWVPVRWPRNFRTLPEVDQLGKDTSPSGFDRDMQALQSLIDRFISNCDSSPGLRHPYLGRLSPTEWKRLGYLHCDHHLRQFGA
jgi:Protein of unknown function (DUF1569)